MPRPQFTQFTRRALFVAVLVAAAFFAGGQFGVKRERQRLKPLITILESQARDVEQWEREARERVNESMPSMAATRAAVAAHAMVNRRIAEFGTRQHSSPMPQKPKSPKVRLMEETLDKVDCPELPVEPSV